VGAVHHIKLGPQQMFAGATGPPPEADMPGSPRDVAEGPTTDSCTAAS